MMIAVGLLLSSTVAAQRQVVIHQTGQGDVSYSLNEGYCELSMTPASGFYITGDHITVYKTIAGGSAQSPRRSPGIAEPIALTIGEPDANPTGKTWYRFSTEGDFNYEVHADFQEASSNKLLLVGGKMVTDANRLDILKDGGSLKFDGKKTLTLNSAFYNDGSIETWIEDFVIYLNEENTLTTRGDFLIKGHGGKLTFSTEGNTPGKLTATIYSENAVVSGFAEIGFEQNLALLSGSFEGNTFSVGTPVKPIVDKGGDENVVDVGTVDVETPLDNTIIGDVLYTLDKNNDDGIDKDDNCVVLGSTMVEEDVEDIISNYSPGTEEFAEHFAGLTFMVPAGYGKVFVTARTGEEGVLNVKIGTQEPYVITGALEFQEFTFPYVCTEATYVYVYSSSPRRDAEAVEHHAGKKTTVTIGVGSVGVSSGAVQSSNGTTEDTFDNDDVLLSDDKVTYDDSAETLMATDPTVNAIADDAFVAFPFLKYIDLSNTSITGLKVSRSEGPFKGVSKNTFIYLPAGNSSDEPNVVIGNVCSNVVLDGQMSREENESFGLSSSFVAQQVVFDRSFADGKMVPVYLPFFMNVEQAGQYGTFYAFDNIDNGKVVLELHEYDVESHTAYLFKPNSPDVQLKAFGVELSMPDIDTGARQFTAAKRRAGELPTTFYGTYDFFNYQNSDGDIYRLTTKESGDFVFVRMKEGDWLRPFEGFLYANGETRDSFDVEGEGITGIVRTMRTVGADYADGWCGLSGLRFRTMPTQKGIYIHNGRKVVVK